MLNLIREDAAALAAPLNYDYSLIAEEHREKVRSAARDIKHRERRAVNDIAEIGKSLADVRDRLEYGQFGEWIEQEFGWRKTMAYTFMNVAEALPKFGKVENFGLSALYQLSAPSTPDEAIEEANQIAENGQRVNHKIAKVLVDKHKPPKPETPTQFADRVRREAAATRAQQPTFPALTPAEQAEAARRKAAAAEKVQDWAENPTQLADRVQRRALVAEVYEALEDEGDLEMEPGVTVYAPPDDDDETATIGLAVAIKPPNERNVRVNHLLDLYRQVATSASEYSELTGDYVNVLALRRALEPMITALIGNLVEEAGE